MFEIREYLGLDGRGSFSRWFEELNHEAARRVLLAIYRLGLGNLSNAKPVGNGVHEARIFFGPGYRIYFALDGKTIILLLHGGTKARQQNDIQKARELWTEYKEAKRSCSWR